MCVHCIVCAISNYVYVRYSVVQLPNAPGAELLLPAHFCGEVGGEVHRGRAVSELLDERQQIRECSAVR